MGKEIENSNKLIAEFMGTTFEIADTDVYTDGRHEWFVKFRSGACFKKFGMIEDAIKHCEFKYHSSFDWLMPVVEKINNICSKNSTELSNHSRDQEHLENPLDNPNHWKSWSYHYIHLSTDIESVWEDCVKFIQWFNNENKSQ